MVKLCTKIKDNIGSKFTFKTNFFLSSFKFQNSIFTTISRDINETKIFLKNNNLLITKADKRNLIVVMENTNYSDNIEKLLNEKKTYQKLTSDPTKEIQTSLNILQRYVFY